MKISYKLIVRMPILIVITCTILGNCLLCVKAYGQTVPHSNNLALNKFYLGVDNSGDKREP